MGNNDLLVAHHLASLHSSAISDEVILARGYRTILNEDELRELGFSPKQRRVPGLLIPLWTTDGQIGMYVYRPDNPRIDEKRDKTNPDRTHPLKVIKYEIPKGQSVRLDCPPTCQTQLADPAVTLWITEGQKKADCLASLGKCAIALLGVWNFLGKSERGGVTFLADWDYIALKGRDVRLIFDSDILTKRPVQQALERLKEHLQRKGANVAVVYLPPQSEGAKLGVDDWLAAGHTVEELESLVNAPRPLPKPAAPRVELLESAPNIISKPLSLIDGHAYAASWVYIKTIQTESLNQRGEIVRHEPPREKNERTLVIIRDDGIVFGIDRSKSLDELGFEIRLPENPPPEKLWPAQAIKKYVAGNRPSPGDVFTRLVNVVDHFIDFDRSLADQRTMAEFIACYILTTWFLDSFNVIGFLWPSGDRGSGKTNLLSIVAQSSYLGQLILAGGSFASLRDLADYGATLAFDDAENLSDPKRTDPDKRALLLAGNRRGVTVPVKEPGPDKTWRTRYVNAFCPRLFSAIRLPDPVLASRTIIIPLTRTADRTRANLDPMDHSAWPCSRNQLLNDLWALALANLTVLPKFDDLAARKSSLLGRTLQPWRAILAVAAWLDDQGVSGLWKRIETLSLNYQNERPDFESSDMTALVVKAMLHYAITNLTNIASIANLETPSEWQFETAELTEICKQLAEESESDLNLENITKQRIGWVCRKMRLTKPPRPFGQRARLWKITRDELIKNAISYGISIPETLQGTSLEIGDVGNIGNIGDITSNHSGNELGLVKGVL